MPGKNVFIVGPGLIGWTILDLLVAEGYKVTGLVRRQEHADGLKQSGAEAVIGDLHDAKLIAEHVSKNDIVFHTATADEADVSRRDGVAVGAEGHALNVALLDGERFGSPPLPAGCVPQHHTAAAEDARIQNLSRREDSVLLGMVGK